MQEKVKIVCNGRYFLPVAPRGENADFAVSTPTTVPIHYGHQSVPLSFTIELPKGVEAILHGRTNRTLKVYRDGMLVIIHADVETKVFYGSGKHEVVLDINVTDWRVRVGTFFGCRYYIMLGDEIARMAFRIVPNTLTFNYSIENYEKTNERD